jgi:predicted fused transcriptional regulator/phosphomethylpyrimidine kinase
MKFSNNSLKGHFVIQLNVSLKNRKKVLNIRFDELIINIETFEKYLPSYFEKNSDPSFYGKIRLTPWHESYCWYLLDLYDEDL